MSRRAATLSAIAITLCGAALLARAAAPTKPALEIWGALPGDVVEIDGNATTIKPGTTPRPFEGEPLPGNASVTLELAPGRHAVVIRREGCTARTFNVEVQGAHKRSIVLAAPQPSHCALPPPPPRAPS